MLNHKLSNINILWASIIIEEWFRLGVRYFCICPGSRSTPLVMAIAYKQKENKNNIQTIVCYDERGAMFHALGYSKATKEISVVVTTSGSAIFHTLPALVENNESYNTPIWVVSADRPYELHDNQSNQTTYQKNINSYFYLFKELPNPTKDIPISALLSNLNQIHYESLCQNKSIHYNIPFREPFINKIDTLVPEEENFVSQYFQNSLPYSQHLYNQNKNSDFETIHKLIDKKKIIFIIGENHSDVFKEKILSIIKKYDILTLADITSNLPIDNQLIFRATDFIFQTQCFKSLLEKTCLIHLGGRLVSKYLYLILQKKNCLEYVVIQNRSTRLDPNNQASYIIHTDPLLFLESLNQLQYKPISYMIATHLKRELSLPLESMLTKNKDSLTEKEVALSMNHVFTKEDILFIGNSMPIRDLNNYAFYLKSKVYVNRGVSGIDGLLATSIGLAVGTRKRVISYIGDVSFIHDINSLTQLQTIKKMSILFIVINNYGCGIFKKLPIHHTEEDIFSTFFTAPHQYSFEYIAKTYFLEYQKVHSFVTLNKAIDLFNKKSKPMIIEVTTQTRDA